MEDTNFERQNERYAEHLDRGWHKILTELEWKDLRNEFYLDCVGEINGKIVVGMSPHNTFQWFRSKLDQTVKPASGQS